MPNEAMNPKPTVIYHKSDYDGIFCREIARKFLPDAELIGWEYGETCPAVPESSQLYILDLSVPELMERPRLIWIDHHKSAIDKYSKDIAGYRIDGVAACRLAWQWFRTEQHIRRDPIKLPDKAEFVERDVTEPFAVRLAGEYDIWDKRDERAELFQHGLRSQELTDEVWKELLDPKATIGFAHRVQVLLTQGKAIQFFQRKQDASLMLSRGFEMTWEGLRWLCVNTGRFNSLTFDSAVKPEHDALLGFAWNGPQGKWTVSLYHAPGKEHHDLSLIAVKHGGGGHRGACGFTCSTLNQFPL